MKNNILKATHEGKISIANIELNAAVLEDGTRVLSTTAMQRLLGVISNEPSQRSSKRLEEIITSKAVKPFIEASLISSKLKPIYCFIGNQKISAYEAMVLPEEIKQLMNFVKTLSKAKILTFTKWGRYS